MVFFIVALVAVAFILGVGFVRFGLVSIKSDRLLGLMSLSMGLACVEMGLMMLHSVYWAEVLTYVVILLAPFIFPFGMITINIFYKLVMYLNRES